MLLSYQGWNFSLILPLLFFSQMSVGAPVTENMAVCLMHALEPVTFHLQVFHSKVPLLWLCCSLVPSLPHPLLPQLPIQWVLFCLDLCWPYASLDAVSFLDFCEATLVILLLLLWLSQSSGFFFLPLKCWHSPGFWPSFYPLSLYTLLGHSHHLLWHQLRLYADDSQNLDLPPFLSCAQNCISNYLFYLFTWCSTSDTAWLKPNSFL